MYIITAGNLDRETNDSYTLSLIARETTTEEKYATDPVEVQISIMDINDNGPEFVANDFSTDDTTYKVSIKENIEIGQEIISISATDLDLGANGEIDFEFVNQVEPFGLQQANNTATIILLSDGLEKLVAGSQHTITIHANDRAPESVQKSNVAIVQISVTTVNNTSGPVFTQNVYEVTVSEASQTGFKIITVSATDIDNGIITYSILSGNVDNDFAIEPSSGDVSVVNELDREKLEEYKLVVIATDGNKTSQARLDVIVTDVNDNDPAFNASWPTEFTVQEEGANLIVGQVMAYDIDEPGNPNSEVGYSLDSESFQIDSTNGIIYTLAGLDRETQDLYQLTVTATDKSSKPRDATASFTVRVTDINDHGASFPVEEYQASVQENMVMRDFYTIEAIDEDLNPVLEYMLVEGNASMFAVNSTTGSISLLTPLDFESVQSIQLIVGAVDIEYNGANTASATATLDIIVQDINDNAPQFEQSQYQASVIEKASFGTVVVDQILATDAESPNSEITYAIIKQDDLEAFYLKPPSDLNQWVVLVTNANLQSLNTDVYTLTIMASDDGQPSLNSTTTVVITITDRSPEETPEFLNPLYSVSDFKEGQPANSLVTTIEATVTISQVVYYHIISGNEDDTFWVESVNKTVGVIYTSRELDRETISSYQLLVEATVSPTETATANTTTEPSSNRRRKRQTTTNINVAEVIIDLVDVNDNHPQFSQEAYYSGIDIGADIYTTILEVEASDPDLGAGGEVTLSLNHHKSEESGELFQIAPSTGVLTSLQTLGGKDGEIFEFTVLAADSGDEHLESSALIYVAVITNDYRAVLVASIEPSLVEKNAAKVREVLEELLNATVVLENIGPRMYGINYDKTDASMTDITFYALQQGGQPLTRDEILRILNDKMDILDQLFQDLLNVEEVRPPAAASTTDTSLTVIEVFLIILACLLFIISGAAIFVVYQSWKK